MGAKLKTIKISGFRGFNSEIEIPLDEVVLVYGLNGSGKSSFAEAIEWLFFEDISRRRLSPCPGEYAGSYLKNLYAPPGKKSFVEVGVEKEGAEFTLRKELESERTGKLFLDGTAVSNFESILPGFKSHHRPLLAQVEISALVNTEQKDRWEQLAKILGQEELTILRKHLIDLRSNKLGK
ncbi:MAG: AAA family ATPase [candidate division Zixibacteria bacterium]|nr:AAA family ATPase [candidate division Zixibacteria bacterium]